MRTAWGLDADDLAAFEDAVVPVAREKTVSGLKRTLRQFTDTLAPETLVQRHRKAYAERHIVVAPADDGMAYLTAYLSAVHATAIENRLTDTASSLRASAELRTKTQLMVDVLLDEHIPLTAWAGEDPMIRAFRTGGDDGAWAAGSGPLGSDGGMPGGVGFADSSVSASGHGARSGKFSISGRASGPDGPDGAPRIDAEEQLFDPRYFDLGFIPPDPDDHDFAPPGAAAPDESRARYRGIY